jgi:MerR family redox-sensitive transcriptional activator SoxR
MRRYDAEIVRRLEVIAIAKEAGFTLEQVGVILSASDTGEDATGELRRLANERLPEVEALITRAEAMRDWLRLAQGCGCPTIDVCALFDERSSTRSAAAEPAA